MCHLNVALCSVYGTLQVYRECSALNTVANGWIRLSIIQQKTLWYSNITLKNFSSDCVDTIEWWHIVCTEIYHTYGGFNLTVWTEKYSVGEKHYKIKVPLRGEYMLAHLSGMVVVGGELAVCYFWQIHFVLGCNVFIMNENALAIGMIARRIDRSNQH